MRPSTRIVQGSQGDDRNADPLTTPIYETTTFLFENAAQVRAYNEGKTSKYLYSRYGNPTVLAVEKTLATLHNTETALLFASGQAATTTALLGLLSGGQEVVCSAAIYGGTLHLLADLFSRFAIKARFVTVEHECCGSSHRLIRPCGAWTSGRLPRHAVNAASSPSSTTRSPVR